jgi:hypothetical protein
MPKLTDLQLVEVELPPVNDGGRPLLIWLLNIQFGYWNYCVTIVIWGSLNRENELDLWLIMIN